MSSKGQLIAVTLALVLGCAGGAWAFAPYLPQLMWEGSPGLYWSDHGTYADVKGATSPRELSTLPPPRTINARLQELFQQSEGVALLLARDGKLELEHYEKGTDETTRFNSFSMAKSLVGALVFKALAEQKLGSLDQTLGELLPQAIGLKHLTLKRLLDMRAGIHFDSRTASFGAPGSVKDSDTFPNPFGPLARLHFQGLQAIVAGLTMDEEPSDEFNYQNVSTALLGAVLERAYNQPLEALLSEKIWQPAGAATAAWRKPAPEHSVSAYCCLFATARDWVRIGMFFVSNGNADEPFLPAELWRQFLGLDTPLPNRQADDYSSHTFHNVLDREGEALQGPFTYFMGQNGQTLYLMPEQGLVVYRAGEHYQLLHSTLYEAWNSTSQQRSK
jgi:CubicO group peptidase (beta-lactamase class C family)